jgi:hypothetical protein
MRGFLLHEMAHADTSGEHDQRWEAEMVRLKRAGAPIPDWEFRSLEDALTLAGQTAQEKIE